MVTTYELIKHLEEIELFKPLLSKGIVSVKYLNDKEMFERYMELRKTEPIKSRCLIDVSIEFNVSFDTVKRVVRKMKC